MSLSLEQIEEQIIKLALFFIEESQKKECFFEKYLKTDLSVLREHKIEFGDETYFRYLLLMRELTEFLIRHSFNINDFVRRYSRPSAERAAEELAMNKAIVAYKQIPPLSVESNVENREARKIVIDYFVMHDGVLSYDKRKSTKTSIAITVRSEVIVGLYLFIELGRIGSYEIELGMVNPKFVLDVGHLFSGRSIFWFDTVDELNDCLADTRNLIVELLPYLEKALEGSLTGRC